jgi:hypothetical protein
MGHDELYLEQEYLNHLNIVSRDDNGIEDSVVINISDKDASKKLLDVQDLLLQRVPEGKTKSVTIASNSEEVAHIDISPLNILKTNIEQLHEKISKLSEIEETFKSMDSLTDTYKRTNELYEEKLVYIESLINKKFGIVDNTINKQNGQESPIKSETFSKLSTTYSREIKEYFKNSYKKLFQGKTEKTTAENKSMNNALSAKLKLKENLLKEFRNTRATANPDQIAEELLLSLIRPVKAVSNALHQYGAEAKELKQNTEPAKLKPSAYSTPEATVKVNGTQYSFLGYSKDYTKVLLKDAKGIHLEAENSISKKLQFGTMSKLNPIQKDLLNMGKSLVMSDRSFPYKLSKSSENDIVVTTINISEFAAGKKQSNNKTKSKSQSI